ncbi:heavy metal translocating P-type ATPase [Filifactor villosus]|uniref:Cd(2+)-exporting ATPase n=1 Tax=Filifactor villosus TaxID=29374 RepID=A0ABV9QJM4_9FIRM
MKYSIVHSIPGRLRLMTSKHCFSTEDAYRVEDCIRVHPKVEYAEVNPDTGSLLIRYLPDCKEEVLQHISSMDRACLKSKEPVTPDPHRELKKRFERDLFQLFFRRFLIRTFIPSPIGRFMLIKKYMSFLRRGTKSLRRGKVNVDVLDAASIGISILQSSYSTAGSVMTLLQVSEILESYTKERVKLDLSNSLSINVDKVWKVDKERTELVPLSSISIGDLIQVQTGMMIPLDGEVTEGLATVDESSMTGESVPAAKSSGSTVFAGTVISEGCLTLKVRALSQDSRINHIVEMIDTGEERKASIHSKAEHIADSIAPYSFLLSGLVYLFTRNLSTALSVLMVDYSCAIKLATPISVIAAIREASMHEVMVKGGKYLELMAESEVIVFDKTGTLTSASPTVTDVIAFGDYTKQEVLRISACIEEHFPHSVAKAIVKKSEEEGLHHEEEHAKVEYIVAHGITTTLHGKKAVIGSHHFVFEDENVFLGEDERRLIEQHQSHSSLIYLGIDGVLAGFICIDDPPRPEAENMIASLKDDGISKTWMITGDGKNAASYVASLLRIDDFKYQVLPEHKVELIETLRRQYPSIIMVGDGINDSPALSAADVSITLKDASDIAREVSDIVILSNRLNDILFVRKLGKSMLQRIHSNFRTIIFANTLFLGLGIFHLISPRTVALLHNASTTLIALDSTKRYFPAEKQ